MARRTCHSVGFVTMRLIIGVLTCVLVLSTNVLSFAWHSKIGVLLGLFHSLFFFVHLILLYAYELPITLVLDRENKIQTTIIFRYIQFLIQVGLHTYMGHIIDAIATKHLLCITELNLRYLQQLW